MAEIVLTSEEVAQASLLYAAKRKLIDGKAKYTVKLRTRSGKIEVAFEKE